MHQLCREAHGITGHAALTEGVYVPVRSAANDDLISQFGEEGVPEGKKLIHSQCKGKSYRLPRASCGLCLILMDQLLLVGVEVVLIVAAAVLRYRTVTAVSADESSVPEAVDREQTVVRAPFACGVSYLVAEFIELFL